MNSKHAKTLAAIFARPTSAAIGFQDIEALLAAVGCAVTQGAGSRVRFDFTFAPDASGQARNLAFLCHRPHPGKEAKRYQVDDVRQFLTDIGVKP